MTGFFARFWPVVAMLLAATGCSGKPARPAGSGVDPQAAGTKAVADFDANHDGALDDEELKKCPGLRSSLQRADTDKDGKLSAEEIAARIQSWLNSGTVVMEAAIAMTLDGQPLAGATVSLDPEPFLGDGFHAAQGSTNKIGQVVFTTSTEFGFPGLYLGFYRVRVTKSDGGKELIPAKYNTETELGCEIADDIADRTLIEFHLLSK